MWNRILRFNQRFPKQVIHIKTAARKRRPFLRGTDEETRIPFSLAKPSSMGKAKRRRLRRKKRKPTPPRCARQPLPREGARVDTPSFLWKEVPRRGGGWMGKAGWKREGIISGRRFTKASSARKQLIKPIYSYKKRKSNAANDFNVIDRSGYRYMQEKSEAVHFYD